MSTLKSSAEHLTLNADGSGNDIKFQSNATQVAAIDQSGNLTLSGTVDGVDIQTLNTAVAANTAKTGITSGQATAITAALPKAGGTMTGDLIVSGAATPKLTVKSGNGTSASIKLQRINENDTSTDYEIKNDGGVLKIIGDNSSQNEFIIQQIDTGTQRFNTNNTERMRINAAGEVLIGTTTQGRETDLAVVGTDQSPTGAWSQFGIYSNDSYAVNKGGTMMFGGQDGLNVRSWFAGIKGAKENSTNQNYAGYLAFYTRPSGAVPVERMRITSDGRGLSQFTAKAWCKWAAQGSSSNLTYGHNVSSVSYVATGHWRINYTNSLTYNYSATMMVSDNGGRNTTFKVGEFEQAYCGVYVTNMSQTATTSAIACFTAFGE